MVSVNVPAVTRLRSEREHRDGIARRVARIVEQHRIERA
jgi:hypothetical protein